MSERLVCFAFNPLQPNGDGLLIEMASTLVAMAYNLRGMERSKTSLVPRSSSSKGHASPVATRPQG